MIVTIRYNRNLNEYKVPGIPNNEANAYYTDDRKDAIDTAKSIYGTDVTIKIGGTWVVQNPMKKFKPYVFNPPQLVTLYTIYVKGYPHKADIERALTKSGLQYHRTGKGKEGQYGWYYVGPILNPSKDKIVKALQIIKEHIQIVLKPKKYFITE
jgi:hypothetical protein